MQGKLSSRSNSIWSINNQIELFKNYSRQDNWIWWSNILQNINEPELCFGQLDQSREQTICNIHTNIIMRQTNPSCTEAFRENSNSKKPRHYVARATINQRWAVKPDRACTWAGHSKYESDWREFTSLIHGGPWSEPDPRGPEATGSHDMSESDSKLDSHWDIWVPAILRLHGSI